MGPARPTERIVVVGASLAGVTLADAVRRQGFTGSLTLVGAEPRAAYNRPALSKGVLDGTATDADITLPPLTCDVDEIVGTAAAGLDVDRREVVLEDGRRIPYDRLAVTTGARARRLADLGAADPGVHETVFRDLDDARHLAAALRGRPKVVIVGAGILGMELASVCAASGAAVVVVDRQPPLLAQLGRYLSDLLADAASAHGVELVHDPAGVRLRGTGTPVVELAGGGRIEGDLVLSAVGCAPNVGWLARTGLLTDGGLRVDARCRAAPGVVAAGDVAAFPVPGGGHRRTPSWNSALEQGRAAARTLVDGDDAPALVPSPYFWTEQFGLTVRICGELPARGTPALLRGGPPSDGALLRWSDAGGGATAAAVNTRMPIARLRALTRPEPVPLEVQR
ncbi:NAD(P)/FAD-dependent oxidoreductase [Pseudonocardia broussonetiae]|uniref:FAD-dependent oxidoreductase n=1 Tax=Pseudonocardia broussonetiae TaxID=2736640 RepID=A0A6M6JUY9_9PSEU|nr:FAD-dependent oxidoreductase [Pseudonocardia broussonetiae]QJY49931.1 FAD-dependent oxidoreductase [Pseudonocardia broussonetiae]